LQEYIWHLMPTIGGGWTLLQDGDFIKYQDEQVDQTQVVKDKAKVVADALIAAAAAAAAATAAAAKKPATTSMYSVYKMKRMYTDYKDISKRHFFAQWIKEVKVTAHTHQCTNPLNPLYVPTTDEDKAIFAADNAFMFNVAAKTVKYPSGKTIIQRHMDDMDGQVTFTELTTDATAEVVAQINETKLEETLRAMEAHPDKWHGTGESFLNSFETKLVQLNDSRSKPVEELEVHSWLTYFLRGHPAAMSSINQQRQLEIRFKETNPGFTRTFASFMNGIRVSLQQYDEENKFTNPSKKAKAAERRANAFKRKDGKPKRDKESFEKYKKELQAINMWLDPAAFNKLSPAAKTAHTEKTRALRQVKRGASTPTAAPTAETTPAAPVPTVPTAPATPQTYVQAANQTETPAGPVPTGVPGMYIYMGRVYKLAVARQTYKSNGNPKIYGSLVDGGCNGGLASDNVMILSENSFGKVDIVGVGDNLIKDVPLCTAAGYINTKTGPIIAIMHNYAALKKGSSIHSSVQLKDHGIMVDDTPKSQKRFDGAYGRQMIRIPTDETFYDVELKITGGLAYFEMVPPTMEQLNDESIPHVHLTSDMPWDPSK
jgi:hypothetical protein